MSLYHSTPTPTHPTPHLTTYRKKEMQNSLFYDIFFKVKRMAKERDRERETLCEASQAPTTTPTPRTLPLRVRAHCLRVRTMEGERTACGEYIFSMNIHSHLDPMLPPCCGGIFPPPPPRAPLYYCTGYPHVGHADAEGSRKVLVKKNKEKKKKESEKKQHVFFFISRVVLRSRVFHPSHRLSTLTKRVCNWCLLPHAC